MTASANSHLDIVANHKNIIFCTDFTDFFQPFDAGHINTAFGLNGLKENSCRFLNTGMIVFKNPL